MTHGTPSTSRVKLATSEYIDNEGSVADPDFMPRPSKFQHTTSDDDDEPFINLLQSSKVNKSKNNSDLKWSREPYSEQIFQTSVLV